MQLINPSNMEALRIYLSLLAIVKLFYLFSFQYFNTVDFKLTKAANLKSTEF